MDSGSGSLQSSSGGDDEYDSHHQHPQLFPPPPQLFFNPNLPPPQSIHHQHHQHHHQQQQFPFHLSHHNYQNPHLQTPTNLYDFPSDFNTNFNPPDSFANPTSLRSDPTVDGSTQNRQTNPSSAALHPKSTAKKRTRASRRAPTTVLTTDTTNFRAMVQEFTGIPSPPFNAAGSSSSSYSSYSRRFDLFGSGSGSGSSLYPSRSKVQLLSSLNTSNNAAAAMEDQNAVRNFSFQSVSEGTQLEPLHINCSSNTGQQLLSVLQNDHEITWRGSSTAGIAATTATTTEAVTRSSNNNNAAAAAAANCKFNFTGSSSSTSNILQLQRDKEMLLGNIVVSTTTTTRGESTVNSWIYPSD